MHISHILFFFCMILLAVDFTFILEERLRAGEKGVTEDDGWMASQLNECKFDQTPGDSEKTGKPACCSAHDVTAKYLAQLSD